MLSRHILPENLIEAANKHAHKGHTHRQTTTLSYGSRYESQVEVPKFRIPPQGCPANQAYQLIHDMTELDGRPNLNLASFVHTWMPEEADKLMMENINKNLVDQDEYPSMTMIQTRCVSMIADLWHAESAKKAIGTATTGSSEAIMLGGLALKKRWQAKRKEQGKSIHEPGPNIVMAATAQVALEKFARYFDVEARLVPVTVESNYVMSPKEAMKYVDENTIGIFVILGSTYTGHFEDVKGVADELDKYQKETGIDIPIHVDAASGGFVTPFAYPKHVWDFKLPRVASINSSGHKYGMSYAGIGWVVWAHEENLPKESIFELHYSGSTESSFNLNFSRPAHPVLGSYFNFINLGFSGYRAVMLNNLRNARTLSRALELSGYFMVLSDVHRREKVTSKQSPGEKSKQPEGFDEEDDAESFKKGLPVVSFRFTDEFKEAYPDIKQSWIQELLRKEGWIVPNYALAPHLENIDILRVVIRESMTGEAVERLVEAIVHVVETLIDEEGPFVAQLKSERNKGQTAQDSKGPAVHTLGTKDGSLERQMGSLNISNDTYHTGTYAKQC